MSPDRITSVRILGIDADSGTSTELPSQYRASHVYPYLNDRFPVKQLRGQNEAERDIVEQESVHPAVRFITGVGHGYANSFLGYGQEVLFRVGEYEPESVHGKIVHFFSCESASRLGPDFLRNGCLAFFGYDDVIFYDVDDPNVWVYFACDSAIDIGLANLNLPAVVFEQVLDKFDQEIDRLRGLLKWSLAADLKWMRDCLRLLMADPELPLENR